MNILIFFLMNYIDLRYFLIPQLKFVKVEIFRKKEYCENVC
jgi:hypothetical protein